MKRRHELTCGTRLPLVEKEEGGRIVVWPGENFVEALIEHMVALGLTPNGPHCLGDSGWEVWAPLGRGQVYFRINYLAADEIMVPVSYEGPFWDRLLRKDDPAFPEFITRFATRLRADERFLIPKWHLALRPGEYEEIGTDEPVV